jgi:hypothetical protein
LSAGCDRSPPPVQATAARDPIAEAPREYTGPLDTVRLAHRCRAERRHAALGEFLVPEQRDAVLDQILSVDELTSAGESLRQRVGARVGEGSAVAIDRTAVANMIGPFSRDVECLSESLNGDTATVSIRVGGRLPLEQVRLVRREERWLIETDPPIPALASELRQLAKATLQVVRDMDRYGLSTEQIEKELALRQAPILKRIDALVSAQTNASQPRPSDG